LATLLAIQDEALQTPAFDIFQNQEMAGVLVPGRPGHRLSGIYTYDGNVFEPAIAPIKPQFFGKRIPLDYYAVVGPGLFQGFLNRVKLAFRTHHQGSPRETFLVTGGLGTPFMESPQGEAGQDTEKEGANTPSQPPKVFSPP
jgi:hypothetical protein